MRTKLTVAAGALVFAVASPAFAQQAPTEPSDALTGTIDVGGRATSTFGDAARFERYRDLRSGVFSDIAIGKRTAGYDFGMRAENVGYRDQRYLGDYRGGRLTVAGAWDSVPLNYSYLTSTPWVQTAPGVFTLDAAARAAVQEKVPGVVGVPASAAQLSAPSIFATLAKPFDLTSKRDTASGRVAFDATRDLGVNVTFSTTKKGGLQPFGLSFAFNNANELAVPIDTRTNDVSAGLEWTNPQGMMRVGWDASWFDNRIHEILWDNPLRVTDTNPFDPSGYSNGNGPARGRMSVPPSNSMNVISTTGLYKMPSHTTLNGTVSFTSMNQNDALIPWTSNPAIANPGVYAAFPGLASLPRATADAKMHGLNAMFNFTSRPNRVFGLTMRYRFNDHRNLTPEFDATDYVRFDAAPEDTGSTTEHFNIRENTYDLTGTFNVLPRTAWRVGYTFDDFNRTGRAYSDMRDYTFRTSVDTVGAQYFTLRVSADHTSRIGSGFSEASLEDGGLQPGLRFYDEADRDRNRASVLVVVSPLQALDVTASVTAGKDVYKGPGHEFGLLNNTNISYNGGVSFSPRKEVSFSANVGRETFTSLQQSSNANPPGTDYGSWTDPNRVWSLTNDETVKNADLSFDLIKALRNTDIRLSYSYSDSDNAFVHGGPRVTALTNNVALSPGDTRPCAAGLTSCFLPLPNVTNTWQRVSLDVKYFFTAKVGVAAGVWHERLDVSDFATVDAPGSPGTPRIDYLGEINTGYGNRPYRGNTGLVRLLYAF